MEWICVTNGCEPPAERPTSVSRYSTPTLNWKGSDLPYVGMTTTFTALCTSCGETWQEDDQIPKVCPECAFTGVLVINEIRT